MKKSKEKLYSEIEPYSLTIKQKIYVRIKAILDFIIALFGLIVSSPLFLIIAIIVKIDSKGPVFFIHKRIGKNGKEFNCIKFRTMKVDANHDIASAKFIDADAYITRFGKFLRASSLDELPQLFLLLIGKMSLIGYRPSLDSETELNTAREGFNLYQIRPGITGWAQVNGRDRLAANQTLKAQYDGYYMKHISLWLDIKIFFKTIVIVFKHSDIVEGEIVCSEIPSKQNFSADLELDNSNVSKTLDKSCDSKEAN